MPRLQGAAGRDPELVVDGFLFGEGPRWRDGRLWFSDMLAGVVYSVGDDQRLVVELELARPSGLGFLPDGALLVVGREYKTLDGELVSLPQLVRHDAAGESQVLELTDGSNLNDMVVSAAGFAYLDLYGRTGAPNGVADEIMLFRPDGTTEIVATDLKLPNGMVISADGRTLVVAETMGDCLTAYSISSDGGLTDRRVFAANVTTPDGLCLDAEGAVWTGSYSTSEFLRVSADGDVVDRITLPKPLWAVAPMLGGSDGRTLYMITAETTFEGWPHGRSAGRLVRLAVEVAAAGLP
ncbi:MAG: SMP-30/gluconolactonase/LRE family protein [Acidimicrobiia bacterium]